MMNIRYLGIGITAVACVGMILNGLIFGKSPFPEVNVHLFLFLGAMFGAGLQIFAARR